jgi:hypothetical protein
MLTMVRSASSAIFSVVFALALAGLSAEARAAQPPIFNEVHSIAAPTSAVPQEFTLNIATAGTYGVTLTDLGAQLTPAAPLTTVKMAVTSNGALVGVPLVGPGTATLTSIPAGTYQLHVIGMPGSNLGSGPFAIAVDDSTMTQVAAFAGTLTLPSAALPNGEGVLDDSFTVAASGSYTVTLQDLQLPQSLTTVALLLIQQGGATPLATLTGSGAQMAVNLTTGVTYDVFAVGQANAATNAGLFSAVVKDGAGNVVFGRATPAGNTMHIGSPALTAGSTTLTLTDLKFPAALTQAGAALTLNGQLVTPLLSSTGSSPPFTAVTGTYEAFAVATPATPPGAGSYAVQVTPQGGAAEFAVARGVAVSGGTLTAYSFDTSISAAGQYAVNLSDFQLPAALAALELGAEQGGALLGSASAGGTPQTTFNIGAATGPVSLVAFAQASTGGGLFGIELTPNPGSSPVYDTTQSVGGLFVARQVAITAAGSYSVTATDLGFPAPFTSYYTVVTQGTQLLGSIASGGSTGSFNFTATPGIYFLNFIAQPGGTDQAGTYALTVAPAPPAPVVTLTVDRSQVGSGSTVDLIWSSQNATSCTGTPTSGGWGGTQAVSGTVTSGPLSSTTTFMLSCSGAGGSTSQSVTVTVTAASGGHGGGSLDALVLAVLAALLAARCAVVGVRSEGVTGGARHAGGQPRRLR